jgi:hypothetical protein
MTLPPPSGLGKVQRRTAWAMQLPTPASFMVVSWTTAEGTLPVPPMVNWTATRPLALGSRASAWL